jgi:outer membrane protein
VAGPTSIDIDDSWGLAGELGVDVDVSDRFFLDLSMWYIDLEAEATLKTGGLGRQEVDIDINPFVLLLAADHRF